MAIEPLTRDKRKAQTRAHLLAAAAQVFAERGFHGASLDDIAEAAGFSKGAVYSNFESKDDLFLALIEQRNLEFVADYAAVDDQDYPDAASRITAMADIYLRQNLDLTREWALATEFDLYALRNPELRSRLSDAIRAMRERIAELIRQHASASGVELPLPSDELASLFLAVFQGLWMQKAIDPDAIPDRLAAAAIDLIQQAVDRADITD